MRCVNDDYWNSEKIKIKIKIKINLSNYADQWHLQGYQYPFLKIGDAFKIKNFIAPKIYTEKENLSTV